MTDVQSSVSASMSRSRSMASHPSRRRALPAPAPAHRLGVIATGGLAAAGGVAVFRVSGTTLLAATDAVAFAVFDRADQLARTFGRLGAVALAPTTAARVAYRAGRDSIHDLLTTA